MSTSLDWAPYSRFYRYIICSYYIIWIEFGPKNDSMDHILCSCELSLLFIGNSMAWVSVCSSPFMVDYLSKQKI